MDQQHFTNNFTETNFKDQEKEMKADLDRDQKEDSLNDAETPNYKKSELKRDIGNKEYIKVTPN